MDNNSLGNLELLPGVKGVDAFPTREAQEQFFRDFYQAVRPELEKYDRARAASETWAMTHVIC